jgi:hypothetical protein
MGCVQTLGSYAAALLRCAAFLASSFLVCADTEAQVPQENKPVETAWADELNSKYPGLLAEWGRLFDRLQKNVAFPASRGESQLLPLLPEQTIAYAALPNYGESSHQSLKVFQQELQESAVLRNWWQQSDLAGSGTNAEDALEKFYLVSQYLGDEVVVSATMDGKEPRVLILAEIKKPGLKQILQQLGTEFAGKTKTRVRVVDSQELASLENQRPAGEFLLLVRADLMVGSTDLPTLRNFNARLEAGARGFANTPFGQRIAQAYQDGITLVAAGDLSKMLDQVPPGSKQNLASLQSSGFAEMKYLVWKHTSVAGEGVSESELSFAGPRRGAAAWLAKPAPLGSLDFVSPRALLATTLVLISPTQIFEDVKTMEIVSNPNAFATLSQAEQGLKLTLKDDLLSYLAGEITFELDNSDSAKAEWKVICKVTDAKKLQQTMGMLLAAGRFAAPSFEEAGITYYPVKVPSAQAPMEIDYAYVDGYLIIGSSRETVVETIRLHTSGESLGKSKRFLTSVPPNHSANASGMWYQDPVAMAALKLRQVAPEIAAYLKQTAAGSNPGVIYVYGENSAIGEASRGGTLDVAAILVGAAIAIPKLLKSRIAANEASAVGLLRTVDTAEVTYQVTYPHRGFASDLATLGPDSRAPDAYSPEHAGLIDAPLGNASCTAGTWCKKDGYNFRLTAVCKLHLCKEYVVVATPGDSKAGGRSFCSTSDGLIRFKTQGSLIEPLSAAQCRMWSLLQ